MSHIRPGLVKYNFVLDEDLVSDYDLCGDCVFHQTLAKIRNVLNDERGWTKYGFTFECLNLGNKKSSQERILNIILCSNDKANNECNMGGLSCYDPSQHVIYFNYSNWMTGGNSGMPIDEYRNYVINHEVGHALGFYKHTNNRGCQRDGGKSSVMAQFTKGKKAVSPCVITNGFPLDPNPLFDEITLQH